MTGLKADGLALGSTSCIVASFGAIVSSIIAQLPYYPCMSFCLSGSSVTLQDIFLKFLYDNLNDQVWSNETDDVAENPIILIIISTPFQDMAKKLMCRLSPVRACPGSIKT